jgi:RNA ligase
MEDMKNLFSFGIEHPARTTPFNELKRGLFAEVAADNINVSYHPEFPELALFKYSLNCVFEQNWNKFSLMARGLIIDTKDDFVVATPFLKFFNYGEIESGSFSVIEPEFTVMEKVDGSLGIMFFYAGEWRVSTAGGFSSEQAIWAMSWMKENMHLDALDKTNTYLFEIIYPTNKIVVQYDYEGLVLLNVIDRFGLDYDPLFLKKEAEHLGTRCAKIYDFSDMGSILKKAETLPLSEEGYVIRFKSGIRLKIKGDEYVRVHKIISKVTPLAIWESILCGDNLEDIKKELPEEMEKDFDTMISIFEVRLAAFIKEVVELHEGTKSKSDKELGLLMSAHPEAFSGCEFKTSKGYIFTMRKGQFFDKLNNLDPKQLMRRKVFSAFKPKANFLEGYTPSSAVNRFTDNV